MSTTRVTKLCSGPCETEKPISSFGLRRYKSGTMGHRSYCKACEAEYNANYTGARPKSERTGRFCRECAGMPWRVTGDRCGTCKLPARTYQEARP